MLAEKGIDRANHISMADQKRDPHERTTSIRIGGHSVEMVTHIKRAKVRIDLPDGDYVLVEASLHIVEQHLEAGTMPLLIDEIQQHAIGLAKDQWDRVKDRAGFLTTKSDNF